jgi:hypothetical protein
MLEIVLPDGEFSGRTSAVRETDGWSQHAKEEQSATDGIELVVAVHDVPVPRRHR